MWNWFNCYLSGRHEFGVWCEPGQIFLRWLNAPEQVAPPTAHAPAVIAANRRPA